MVVTTQIWRCPQPQRCFCTFHSTLQQAKHNSGVGQLARKVDTELSLRSLLEMGFTETQAEHLYDAASRVRGGNVAGQVMSTLSVLFVLGLNPSSVLKVLQKSPELYTAKEPQLQQRLGNLRKLGLVEGEWGFFCFFVCFVQNRKQTLSSVVITTQRPINHFFLFKFCVQEVFKEWWSFTPRSWWCL